jgi:hypothetical protein
MDAMIVQLGSHVMELIRLNAGLELILLEVLLLAVLVIRDTIAHLPTRIKSSAQPVLTS